MRTVELTVGAFVLAGILSLLMLAVQVSGLGNLFKEEPGYKVHADFNNVGALKNRAKVSIAGVVVGRVVNIALEPETYNARVTFTVNPSRIEKLPSDSRASIMTAGLLGDSYVAITPGFDDVSLLHEGSIIPEQNTDSAVAFEQLISKFVAGQASGQSASEQSGSNPLPNTTTNENAEANIIENTNNANNVNVNVKDENMNEAPKKEISHSNQNSSINGSSLPMKEGDAGISKVKGEQ